MSKEDDFLSAVDSSVRTSFEAGGQGWLLFCLYLCFKYNRPVPDWAKQAFGAAYDKVNSCAVKSWDDVFGQPLGKGKQLAANQRRAQAMGRIWDGVNARHNRGEPIDKELFESVGKDVNMSGTVVSDIYYEMRKDFRAFNAQLMRKLTSGKI